MDWTKFVLQNLTVLDLRFMVTKPKHPRHEWKGDYCRHINLWAKHGRERLYIPISLVSVAGYIDLINKSFHVTSDIEGAETRLKEVYAYLSEHAG